MDLVLQTQKTNVKLSRMMKLLRADLSIDAQNNLVNFYIAEIQATKILGKWRPHIEKGISEGNNGAVYTLQFTYHLRSQQLIVKSL
jgi:hypothetical protein